MVTNIQSNGYANVDETGLSGDFLAMNLQGIAEPEVDTSQPTLLDTQIQLEQLLAELPEQAAKFKQPMDRIAKCLDLERPFKVAIVAVTGAGKSTLLNSMLARDLVLVKNMGGAATGCALHLHQDVAHTETEKAVVVYRDEESIRSLILKYFVDEYHLDNLNIPEQISESFATVIAQVQPSLMLSDSEQRAFNDLKATLIDLVKQHSRHISRVLKTEFFLDNPGDRAQLLELIDEGSRENQSSNRKVGLVQSVEYHIKSGEDNALKLPDNVCLIDLPGLDGTCLHDIIIKEGIEAADAVLFLVHPRRFKTLNNTELLARVGRFVSSDRDPRSAERIFWVVNAKDDITEEMPQALPKIEQTVRQFLEQMIPGSAQYSQQFIVSAWAALQAQKAMRGEAVEAVDKYAGVQRVLGVAEGDHAALLKKSDVPELVNALNDFVKVTTERQIRSARYELCHVIKALRTELERQKDVLTDDIGDGYQSQKVRNILDKRQKQAEEIMQDFRREQLSARPRLEAQLQAVADRLCDEMDASLQTQMPEYWQANFHDGTYAPDVIRVASVNREPFLGQVEVSLWKMAAAKVEVLAQEITLNYEKGIGLFDLSSRIAELSSEHIEVALIEQKLRDEILLMGNHLSQAVRGFALCHLVNPENRFVSYDEGQENTLLAVLKGSVMFDRDLPSTAFDQFTQAMRSHYSPLVRISCLSDLINLYLYEMIRIENQLKGFLQQQFDLLRRSDSITVDDFLVSVEESSKWQQLEVVNRQLRVLHVLKTLMNLGEV